jgi:CheY-like chemotaxis protein
MEAGTKPQAIPQKLKLLIVDDEPNINDTLAIIFRTRGYTVITANTGAEALRHLSQEQPDLALLDVALPDMSGIEIAIRIRSEYPNCKFLLFSGNQGTIDALLDAKARGHDFDVLAKPIPPQELIDALKSLASQRE